MATERRNTHRLPQGEPLRKILVSVFRGQRALDLAALTGRKDDQSGGLDRVELPNLDHGLLPMAERMTPTITLTWEQAGRALRARLGLDPDGWEVTNPHISRVIGQSILDFCAATNATTSLAREEALRRTREAIAANVVAEGAGLRDLTKRINRIYDQAETYRARRIAATETSRAHHAAQDQAADESGVVAGFEWLISSDACSLCQKVYREARMVRLGQPFAIVGDNPTYSTVRFPPLHPHDQCTVLEVLKPEYGGPESPEWAETLIQPQDESEPEPEAKPEPAPKPSRTPKPLIPGEPILSGKPIARRIAGWEGAKPRLAALQAIDNTAMVEAQAARDTAWAAIGPFLVPGTSKPRRDLNHAERVAFNELALAFNLAQNKLTFELGVLRIKLGAALRLPDEVPGTTPQTLGMAFPDGPRQRFEAASEFLAQTCKAAAASVVPDRPGKDGRAFYNPKKNTLGLGASSPVHTAVHELMHAIEEQNPSIGSRALEFRAYRVGREASQSLAELFPDREFHASERGAKDRFDRHFDRVQAYYVGKDYGGSGTEILSMGVEALLKNPAGFAKDDPEFCTFVLGVLSGEL